MHFFVLFRPPSSANWRCRGPVEQNPWNPWVSRWTPLHLWPSRPRALNVMKALAGVSRQKHLWPHTRPSCASSPTTPPSGSPSILVTPGQAWGGPEQGLRIGSPQRPPPQRRDWGPEAHSANRSVAHTSSLRHLTCDVSLPRLLAGNFIDLFYYANGCKFIALQRTRFWNSKKCVISSYDWQCLRNRHNIHSVFHRDSCSSHHLALFHMFNPLCPCVTNSSRTAQTSILK